MEPLTIGVLASSVSGELARQFAKTIVSLKDSNLLERSEKGSEAKNAIKKFSAEPSEENLKEVEIQIDKIGKDDPEFAKAVELLLCLQGLRSQAAKLIPIEEYLSLLYSLRQPSPIHLGLSIGTIWDGMRNFFSLNSDSTKKLRDTLYKDHVFNAEISEIESEVKNGSSIASQALDINNKINSFRSKLDLFKERLNTLYLSSLTPVLACDVLVENMSSKIGHQDLKSEAEMHANVVKRLVDQLRQDCKSQEKNKLGIFDQELPRIISTMVDVEKRRIVVETLIREDWRRNGCTTFFVIVYIIMFLSILIFSITRGINYQVGTVPMNELTLPLLGIPWPVILWSLIGSFASMLYRFNNKQVPDFGSTVKWFITRPVQGIVLGSAFYLVLMSGLFLLTGEVASDVENASPVKDEVILVLSFLVGFSDRFANSVFNALVANFSRDSRQDNSSSPDSESNP
jgi:hypothetical protein